MREREEKRKKKQLAKLMERDNVDLNSKVSEEQRRLLKAQKKLQAIRLIEELFKRIEVSLLCSCLYMHVLSTTPLNHTTVMSFTIFFR